jgi:hypothetical protein
MTHRRHARPSDLGALAAAIARATGPDAKLDAALHELLAPGDAADPPRYTGSVDSSLELLHALLPGWHWHVGHGANGILPYAAVSQGETRFAADAPTVPLALLRAALQAVESKA